MPKQTREIEAESIDPTNDADDDRRFSQDHDDKAGRSWHGMNSQTEVDEVGRFKEDKDEDEIAPRPGRIERA